MTDIIIWGAGNWGEQAYWYYKDKGRILFYVDTDVNKMGRNVSWGELLVRPITDICDYPEAKIIVAVNKNEGIGAVLDSLEVENRNVVYFSPMALSMQNTALMKELNDNRSIDLGALLQNIRNIKLQCTFRCFGSGVLDYAFLRCIAMKYKAKSYLEIGTYIGESLKAVSDICNKCYSITAAKGEPYSMASLCKSHNYPDFTDRLANDDNVEHHYGDSKYFDWSLIPQDIDLYFIDGDHSYRGVYCDTKNIFKHKKKSSIVVWHDFKNDNPMITTSEVALAVKDAIGDEFQNVYCIDNNMCGIYIPPKYQKDFFLKSDGWTEDRQELYIYELDVKCIRHK